MKWYINRIKIRNFKYVHDSFEVELGKNKNLLLYGENGCGKSTIYWALYTLYQSYFKEKEEDVKKYFDTANHQNLLNRYHNTPSDSLIHIEYVHENDNTKTLELSYANTALVRSIDTFVQNTATYSDFINYKSLTSFFDFRNSMEPDIFPFFEKELLPLLDLTDKCMHILDTGETATSYAGEWWSYLKEVSPGLPRKPDGQFNEESEEYGRYMDAIEDFNERLKNKLHQLQDDTKDMLETHFDISDINIEFEYQPAVFNQPFHNYPHLNDGYLHDPKILIRAKVERNIIPSESKKLIEHPKTFFNEAQLTKIALAIRLALFEERSDSSVDDSNALLCIDDMLVSLDMANRMKVIDILLTYQNDYQMIVMTHDKSFYNLLQMEIRRRSIEQKWLYKQMFIPNDIDNYAAIPKPIVIDEMDNFQKAESYIKVYDFAAAANSLRKECEELLQKLYCPNEILEPLKSDGTRKKLQLNNLIQKLPDFYRKYGLPNGITPHLNSYRKAILNPMSHADIDTPFFRNEMMECMEEIKKLKSMRKTLLCETEIDAGTPFKIYIANGGVSQIITFKFKEKMAKIQYQQADYYRNSTIEIISIPNPITGLSVGNICPIKDVLNKACAAVGIAAGSEPALNNVVSVFATGVALG